MTVEDYKRIVSEDKTADKKDLEVFIRKKLNNLPIPTVQVNKNTFIERAVKISKDDGDFDLDRLSYIPYGKKSLVGEGRFNQKEEPLFYAAFTDLGNPAATRYFLATEIDHSVLGSQDKSFKMTCTKWLSKDCFNSIFFVFKKNYCTNDLTKNAFNQITASEEFKNLTLEDKDFFELTTEEFSKTNSINGYTITNIIFDFYKEKGYQSIVYPGVRSKYRGNNIAMLPQVVDDKWECSFGAEFNLIQQADNIQLRAINRINVKGKKLVYSKFGKSEFGEEIEIEK